MLLILSTHQVSAFTNNTTHSCSPPDLCITLSHLKPQTNQYSLNHCGYLFPQKIDKKIQIEYYLVYSPKLRSASYGWNPIITVHVHLHRHNSS